MILQKKKKIQNFILFFVVKIENLIFKNQFSLLIQRKF